MTLRHVTTEADEILEVDIAVNSSPVAVFNYGGDDDLLVRVDGGVPGLGGSAAKFTRVVPPGVRRIIDRPTSGSPVQVRMWSAGVVSVEIEV